jgi:hypothetical protein
MWFPLGDQSGLLRTAAKVGPTIVLGGEPPRAATTRSTMPSPGALVSEDEKTMRRLSGDHDPIIKPGPWATECLWDPLARMTRRIAGPRFEILS